jgi:hypothetical protein
MICEACLTDWIHLAVLVDYVVTRNMVVIRRDVWYVVFSMYFTLIPAYCTAFNLVAPLFGEVGTWLML